MSEKELFRASVEDVVEEISAQVVVEVATKLAFDLHPELERRQRVLRADEDDRAVQQQPAQHLISLACLDHLLAQLASGSSSILAHQAAFYYFIFK
jgi:hypothetical protein